MRGEHLWTAFLDRYLQPRIPVDDLGDNYGEMRDAQEMMSVRGEANFEHFQIEVPLSRSVVHAHACGVTMSMHGLDETDTMV